MASEAATLTLTSLSGAVSTIGVSGAASTCNVKSRPVQIHPKGRECYIDGVRVEVQVDDFTSLENAYFRIGWTDRLNDTVNWQTNPVNNTDQFALNLANSVYDCRFEGRFVWFEIYDTQIAEDWEISAIELYGKPVGGRRN